MMSPDSIPLRLDLQKTLQLSIDWQDGRKSAFPISYLRSLCPCAKCKQDRLEQTGKPGGLSLRVLSSNYNGPTVVTSAELVGNYALRIEWSDGHGSGIYSFEYLRSIDPEKGQK